MDVQDSNLDDDENESIEGINVTPLVDVSLVLVLIFMVTSPFFAKQLIPVKLPEAGSAVSEDRENITVSITDDLTFAVNDVPAEKQFLQSEISKKMKSSGLSFILIRADEKVPHGEVEDVMKMSKRVGAARIAFATTPKVH